MKYTSTRGQAPQIGFCDAVLAGLAEDGGLYLPEHYPQIDSSQIREMAAKPYEFAAQTVIGAFTDGEIEDAALREMIRAAYASFHHPAVAPLVQIAPGSWILELFHGPTLAFKDVAMQFLARLLDHILAQRGRRATIIGATSGDTGGSAIEAFGGRARTDVFILFPKGRVSRFQQLQMTGSHHENVHALAIEGNFDDCQALVKKLFADRDFRLKVSLSGVNSINWARILAQIVYYFTSASALGGPDRRVSFTVPTGNFGDIFAGYAAHRMGLPVEKLVIATNRNDILVRTLETGRYEKSEVHHTVSPSMDIQVSSNFERLLFETCGRDGDTVRAMMDSLGQSGAFSVPGDALAIMRRLFAAGYADEAETLAQIDQLRQSCGYLADPHTAVGLKVAEAQRSGSPMVTLATAHPVKFADAVAEAVGERPELPYWADDPENRTEIFATLPAEANAVRQHILENSRAGAS